MHLFLNVNNEIGYIQNIQAIGELARSRGIIFHVDAAQSAGKIEIDANEDAASMAGRTSERRIPEIGIHVNHTEIIIK